MDADGINSVINNIMGWVFIVLVVLFVCGAFDKE